MNGRIYEAIHLLAPPDTNELPGGVFVLPPELAEPLTAHPRLDGEDREAA